MDNHSNGDRPAEDRRKRPAPRSAGGHAAQESRNKKKKRRRAGLVILIIFLLVLTAVIAGGVIFVSSKLNRIQRTDPANAPAPVPREEENYETDDDDTTGKDTMAPEDVTWTEPAMTEEQNQTMESRHVRNILLIGQDRRPGEVRARSDSMIICSIDEDNDVITLTSLMRDLYVQIPGYSDNRLNASYRFGGMELLDASIEKNFGITIDGNVEVDFNGFIQVMGMIAPLRIDLRPEEAWYMNNGTDWNLPDGQNDLTAEQLLKYSRMRRIGGDTERTARQRRVLTEAFSKIRGLGLSRMLSLVDAALPCITTDLTNAQIVEYVYTVITHGMVLGENHRIPADGTFSAQMIMGMSVLVPDLAANSQALYEYIYAVGEQKPSD